MSLADSLLDQPHVVSGHWKTVSMIVLIFAFGCFSGALSTSMISEHEEGAAILSGRTHLDDLLEQRLMRDLLLEPDQKQQVNDLLAANLAQRKQLEQGYRPQVRALDADTLRKVEAVLKPDQLDQFHHNLALFEQHYGHAVFDTGAAPAPASAEPVEP
jgi:hypothetical protein